MGSKAFVFTGQGSQYVGMGLDLYEALPACRELFDRADAIVGFGLGRICFEGPVEELTRTDVCQPAILVHTAAILAAMKARGVAADAAITGGLSLGEYAALMYAGVIDFETAVHLVHKRGCFMQEASEAIPSGMASVLKLDRERIEAVLAGIDGTVTVANLNCPGQVVISGENQALERAVEALKKEAGSRVIPLKVAGAFHSPVMMPARAKLAEEIDRAGFRTPAIPVVSNTTGRASTDPEELKANVIEQLVAPVLWEQCIRTMMAAGADTFCDIGPRDVLAGLNKRIDDHITTISYDKLEQIGV